MYRRIDIDRIEDGFGGDRRANTGGHSGGHYGHDMPRKEGCGSPEQPYEQRPGGARSGKTTGDARGGEPVFLGSMRKSEG